MFNLTPLWIIIVRKLTLHYNNQSRVLSDEFVIIAVSLQTTLNTTLTLYNEKRYGPDTPLQT